MPRLYIGLVGPIGAGKSVIAEILKTRHDAYVFSGSGYLRRRMLKQGISGPLVGRDQMSAFAMGYKEDPGAAALAFAFLRRARRLQADIAVFDGVRWIGTMLRLQQEPNFHLVYIDAPHGVRYVRVLQREGARGWFISRSDFEQEEALPSEEDIPLMFGEAGVKFVNDGRSKGHLAVRVEALLQELQGQSATR